MTEQERRPDESDVEDAMSEASADTAKVPSEDDPTAEPSEVRDPDLDQS